MQIISNTALISINATLIVQLISFLCFLYIINRIMFKPLKKVMVEREQYVDSLQIDVKNAENEIEQLTSQLHDREAKAKQEAFLFKKELEEVASKKAEEIFTEARLEVNRVSKKTEKEIQAQVDDAKESIQSESEKLAINIMESILGRRVAQ